MAGMRDPCEREGADGKEGNFMVVLKSLTPKARGRPMGILGREEKDHFSSIGCD